MTSRRLMAGLAILALASGALAAPAAAARAPRPGCRSACALVVFVPSDGGPVDDAVAGELAAQPELSIGLLSATEGIYKTSQLLLDLGQGARAAYSAYSRPNPPPLAVAASGAGAIVRGWPAVLARAADARQTLSPGLLAQRVPGGAAYAGVAGQDPIDAVLAADRRGVVGAWSLGAAAALPARVAALGATHRLIVVDLPVGALARAQLHELLAARSPGELVIALERAPDQPGHELLWAGAAGLAGDGGHELTSDTTNQRGLVASIDVAPTVLSWLGQRIPDEMRGRELRTAGRLDLAALRPLRSRLLAIYGRRLPALAWLLAACALVIAVAWPWPRVRRGALRAVALGLLWLPAVVLVPAALEPGRIAERLTLIGLCLALGALSDRVAPWPRGPVVPALVVVVALVVDALSGSQLLARSLLGPNPAFGARFYGIGNELKSGLAVLVFAAVAATLHPGRRSRSSAAAMATAGLVLAVIEGSARLGAGVGGAILVCAGAAVATALLAPGRVTRRRALIVLATPAAALVALGALDLATAHGTGHFTGSVLHARSAGDLRDILSRRYGAAWDALRTGAMPVATGVVIALALVGWRWHEPLLDPLDGDPVWRAALAGGLTAGVVGALIEDSGPVLLVVAAFALSCLALYIHAPPSRARRHLATSARGRRRAPAYLGWRPNRVR